TVCFSCSCHVSLCNFLFFQSSSDPPYLLSFPTRRSSDLLTLLRFGIICLPLESIPQLPIFGYTDPNNAEYPPDPLALGSSTTDRSEEHTSELQSRFDLVCRLLLEKKKINHNEDQHQQNDL